MAVAGDSGGKVALIGIDLDRFKEIDDLRGHGAGDEVLRVLAQRMTSLLRDGEFVRGLVEMISLLCIGHEAAPILWIF